MLMSVPLSTEGGYQFNKIIFVPVIFQGNYVYYGFDLSFIYDSNVSHAISCLF